MTRRSLCGLAIALAFLAAAGWGMLAVASGHDLQDSSRWSWLGEQGGTYWYVPPENLQAFRWETATPQKARSVDDQTLWHIQHYENGYIFGPLVVKFARIPRLCQYLIGSVTPDGRVYISFNAVEAIPAGTPSLTTGFGQMVRSDGQWTFNMQMASGSATSQVTHWAFMRQCTPDDACWTALPGVNQSVPELLAECGDT
jgi:hypothetical protein